MLSRRLFLSTSAGSAASLAFAAGAPVLRMPLAEYEDRARAVWTAQMISVLLGWPFEHKPASTGFTDRYDKTYTVAPVDDDWYYEICALRAFEKHGIDLTVEQYGQQWLENNAGTWGSSEQARLLLMQGVKAPDTGHPRYNRLWFTMGNQCRGDLFGLIAPGMPNLAAQLARKYGHINSYAEGTDGGVLVAAMVSLGFVEKDAREVVRKAARILHSDTPHRKALDTITSMADNGRSFREVADAIGSKWHIEYPATNNAVANGGLAAASIFYGGGDLLKSLNLSYQAADFTDADCNGAVAGSVIAAMHGMKALPEHLVKPLGDRIVGDMLGPVKLTPPVDERISDIARRTVALGSKMIAAHGGKAAGGDIVVAVQQPDTQPAELFTLADLTRYWNPDWTLERAGFGAPGGGVRNLRGGTFLDGEILATYPRDEVRGLLLRRVVRLGPKPSLQLQLGVDPGRAWQFAVHVNDHRVHSAIIDGGPAIDWKELPPLSYPESEFRAYKAARRWQDVAIDLSKFAGETVTVRMYQTILVPNRVPGNAYWRKVTLT